MPAQVMPPAPGDFPAAEPNTELTNDQLASRFLGQATMGPTPAEIAALSAAISANPRTAFADWLDAQFAKEVTPGDLSLTVLRSAYDNKTIETSYRTHAPDAAAIRASMMISENNHLLRTRVAYALSQIFVISDQDNTLDSTSEGLCDWQDMLYRNAFGDFPTLLKEVTYHPVMGEFLSLVGNAKAGFFNPSSRPDENYAREIMQLFTIGLVQLNPDGSIRVDAQGQAIPTYGQPDITELARVFTGLKYPEGPAMGRRKGPDGKIELFSKTARLRHGRDVIEEKRHDTEAKSFLGLTLPAGQDTAKDIDDTLEFLCAHPNTAPFFARGLIQRLITSNPSSAYIQRVSQTFLDSKGDLKAVIRAILLDEEARDPSYARREEYGKLREPWLRVTQLARGFQAKPAATQPLYPVYASYLLPRLAQFPLSAPSVFNFYLPDFQPPGRVSERNANATAGSTLLVAPEFQILNSNTALLTPNYLMDLIHYEPGKSRPHKRLFAIDLSSQLNLADDPAALVGNLNTLLTGGVMSPRTRKIITDAVQRLTPADDPAVAMERVRMAVYLTLISPDYAVQK